MCTLKKNKKTSRPYVSRRCVLEMRIVDTLFQVPNERRWSSLPALWRCAEYSIWQTPWSGSTGYRVSSLIMKLEFEVNQLNWSAEWYNITQLTNIPMIQSPVATIVLIGNSKHCTRYHKVLDFPRCKVNMASIKAGVCMEMNYIVPQILTQHMYVTYEYECTLCHLT